MKRPMTLTAAILGLVAGCAGGIMGILTLVLLIEAMAAAEAGIFTAILLIAIPVIVILVGAILSGVSIGAWAKDAAGYKAKKGVMITAVVFNFLAALCSILFFSGVFYIITGLISLASAILMIVDLALESKRASKTAAPAETPVEE